MQKFFLGIFFTLIAFSIFVLTPNLSAEIPDYSGTWINKFDTAADLGDCHVDINYTKAWLESRGYSREFIWSNYNVWDIDFDLYNSGYEGLDQADFHIHSGHGGTGYILLAKGDKVWGSDVSGNWDWDNEWVFLYTCLTLADHGTWAQALTTGTHGLFGFTTVCWGTNGTLPNGFFKRAIAWGWTPVQAYYGATMDNSCYPANSKAIFITDTLDQWYNDHMWFNDLGRSTAADEYSNDGTYWFATWNTY